MMDLSEPGNGLEKGNEITVEKLRQSTDKAEAQITANAKHGLRVMQILDSIYNARKFQEDFKERMISMEFAILEKYFSNRQQLPTLHTS